MKDHEVIALSLGVTASQSASRVSTAKRRSANRSELFAGKEAKNCVGWAEAVEEFLLSIAGTV